MKGLNITIVIPTFDRPAQLADVLDHILASNVTGLEAIEVIVVDDDSPTSVRGVVESREVRKPFSLEYIYQENAGPAKARNNGLKRAKNEIVLFVDDDVLLLPETVSFHVKAHHERPGSVVFGNYPYLPPMKKNAAYRFLNGHLQNGFKKLTVDIQEKEYIKVETVASGNLSVERDMFVLEGFYRDSLRTPAAEEFELEHRLNTLDIPVYLDPRASGWHLQPPTIEDKARQEYKYGLGAAEVWLKVPGVVENTHLSGYVLENGPIDWRGDSTRTKFKKSVKFFISNGIARAFFLKTAKVTEKLFPSDAVLFPMYKLICGINIFAGVRDGLKKFKTTPRNG